jgi:hypothetical protein
MTIETDTTTPVIPAVTPVVEDKPVVPAVPADKPADTPSEPVTPAAPTDDTPLDTDLWGGTGDSVGDSVLALLQNGGMTPDDAKSLMFDAVQSGDVSKVDRAALEAKVGKDRANLILAGTENYVSRLATQAQTVLTEVHGAVGGKDNWSAITAWAKTGVSEADLNQYRSMIDAGGAQARFAAQELVAKFNSDGSNTTLDAGKQEMLPDAAAAPSGRATTRAEYSAELSKAHRAGGNPGVLAEIQQARNRGRTKGL